MNYFPAFLDLTDKKCVIVGGGEVAHRKTKALIRSGARAHIVSIEFSEKFKDFPEENCFLIKDEFNSKHLVDATLVIAATDSFITNRKVSSDANKLGIPVNVVDEPSLCSFIMPALIDKSPVIIGISTGGNSPVLTRKIKEIIEVSLPSNIGLLSKVMGSWRQRVKERFDSFDKRLRFWENLIDSDVPELVFKNKPSLANQKIEEQLRNDSSKNTSGEVYLVGGGPGDPELLTLKALRLMYKCDVVLYDRLVSKEVLDKVRPDADFISVGKSESEHTVEQHKINEMLILLAKEGKKVLRLKGGDPFIFGRGGEEIDELAKSDIPFQVVPGVTAASGCGSYAGIPLTHRDHSQSVRFLTGHLKDGKLDINWRSLNNKQETLVFYMGLLSLPTICEELIKHGMSSGMPIAAIEHGTTNNQRVVTSTLDKICLEVLALELKSPTTLIIGEVVKLRAQLNWFG